MYFFIKNFNNIKHDMLANLKLGIQNSRDVLLVSFVLQHLNLELPIVKNIILRAFHNESVGFMGVLEEEEFIKLMNLTENKG